MVLIIFARSAGSSGPAGRLKRPTGKRRDSSVIGLAGWRVGGLYAGVEADRFGCASKTGFGEGRVARRSRGWCAVDRLDDEIARPDASSCEMLRHCFDSAS